MKAKRIVLDPNQIGGFIKAERQRLGLTQKELGRLAEVSGGTISRVENNVVSVAANTVFDVFYALGLRIKIVFENKP